MNVLREYSCVCALPVDQRVPHAGGDGGGLRRVTESEHALDDRQLRAGRVQAAERAPVVDHHPRCDDLAAPVHRARLNRKSVTKITMRLVPSSSRDGGTHHQGHLQQRRQLVLIFYRRLRVDEASLVAERAVRADEDLLRYRLTENLHLQRVRQDLLCLLGTE